MSINWDKFKYFERYEFDDPDVPRSGNSINEQTIILLHKIRVDYGMPIITHNKYGLRGCVCIKEKGHSSVSEHYISNGATAVDFHFKTNMGDREQVKIVLEAGFRGVGIYYDWSWPRIGKLSVGFHVDLRKSRYTIWKRGNGKYTYFLA